MKRNIEERIAKEISSLTEFLGAERVDELKDKVCKLILENNPKAEELKKKIAEIKSHRTPPFIEADAYYSREPWRKFGCVGGFVMGWGWFRDEYIYSRVTEKDIDMALNEIKGGANG